MDVAAGAGLRCVHVGVGINPKAAHFLVAIMKELGPSCLRADGHGVIAAERHREVAIRQSLTDALSHLLRRLRNLLQILGALTAEMLFFRQPAVNVARIFNWMS